jgi:hypothetical protein
MFPADHLKSTEAGWIKEPMGPDFVELFRDQLSLKSFEGETFSLFMPLEIQGKTRNYNFIFTIKSVK